MIENAALQDVLENATDLSTVAEIYPADAAPGDDGFDPNDALNCYAAVGDVSFMGVDYTKAVQKFGRIKRTATKDSNTASVDFSNVDRAISRFEFENGFEGLILVIRLFSRSLSDSLDKSMLLFVGRCEKPKSGTKETLSVTATYIVNTLDVNVPRRKFTKEDQEGRSPSDPEFEGFIYLPRVGSTSYTRREKHGGFLGLWNKKTVRKTVNWSGYSDYDASKSVPEVFGRAQIQSILGASIDIGTVILTLSIFCEGEIEDFQNVRTIDPSAPFTVSMVNYSEHVGLVGAANGDTPGYAGSPGFYSRTAVVRADVDGSAIDVAEAPPDIVAVIIGRKMKVPTAGVWGGSEWTPYAPAHIRLLLTDPAYGKLDESWIDDESFANEYEFDSELIFNTYRSDFIFVEAG